MTGQAAAVFDRRIGFGSFFPVASGAVDHGFGVQIIQKAWPLPGSEFLLHERHVVLRDRAPGKLLPDQAEVSAGSPGMASCTLQFGFRAEVSQMNPGGKRILLGFTGEVRRMAADTRSQIVLRWGMILG